MKTSMCIFVLTLNLFASSITGVLEGKREVLVRALKQGEVKSIPFEVGSSVSAADILAVLDDEKSKIERDIAEVQYKTAKDDFKKTKKLKKFVSKEEVLKAKNTYLQKESNFKLKEIDHKNTRIKTPFKGVIAKKYIKLGEMVKAGDKAFEVIQMDELVIDLDVEATKLAKIKLGSKLSFTTEMYKDKSFQGEVYHIGPVIDKASGTVNVKLKLKNKKENGQYILKPGSLVNVDLKS